MTQQPPGFNQLVRLLEALWAPEHAQWPDEIRWSQVLQIAQYNGVEQLLFSVLKEKNRSVPLTVQQAVAQIHYRVAAVNAIRLQELESILNSLATLGRPPLLLKGAALAETLYATSLLRPIGDFDLMVRPEQAQDCRQIIAQMGYIPRIAEIGPGPDLLYHNQQGFDWPGRTRAPIEVHWHLVDTPYYMRRMPMEWFWAQAASIPVGGQAVQILSPEANLLYLPAHLAFHHRYQGLRWYVDLALLIQQHGPDLDWTTVVAQARQFELLLVVREALDRLAGLWPSLALDEPRSQLHAAAPTAFEQQLFHLLTDEPPRLAAKFQANLISLPSLGTKLHYLWLIAFPQRAYMAQRYGSAAAWQLPYWYLYRMANGGIKLLRSTARSLGRN